MPTLIADADPVTAAVVQPQGGNGWLDGLGDLIAYAGTRYIDSEFPEQVAYAPDEVRDTAVDAEMAGGALGFTRTQLIRGGLIAAALVAAFIVWKNR